MNIKDKYSGDTSSYQIWIDTVVEGSVPSVLDGSGAPVSYPSERAAQLEIVDQMMIRLEEFISGDRDFEDAVFLEEYVRKV